MSAVTLRAALAGAVKRLRARDPDGARYDATSLLSHVVGRDAAWLLAHDDVAFDDAELALFEAALVRRERGEPIPYITGSAGFFGRRFAVDPRVLVPRPETEAVVDVALAVTRAAGPGPHLLCDVGTGSGAIAVTLACELPDARITAIDVSAAALAVARRNANAFGAAGRIAFVEGDGLRAAPGAERFRCIVANLPYVRTVDVAGPPHPTSFEPRLALDGGTDGLDLYRALLRDAPARLARDGVVVMEAGPDSVPALAVLARAAFPERPVSVLRDLAGLERLVTVGV